MGFIGSATRGIASSLPLIGGAIGAGTGGYFSGGPAAAMGFQLGKYSGEKLGDLLNYLAGPNEEAGSSSLQQQNMGGVTNEQVQNLLQGIQGQQRQFQPTGFGDIATNIENRFKENVLPGISSQFAGQGGLSSSYFRNAIGRANTGLQERLAALRSQHEIQQQQGYANQQNINQQGFGQMAGFLTGQGQLGLGRDKLQQELAQQQMQNMMMPFNEYSKQQQSNALEQSVMNKLIAALSQGRGVENIVDKGAEGVVPGATKLAAKLATDYATGGFTA